MSLVRPDDQSVSFYYILSDNAMQGPYTDRVMGDLLREGRVVESTLVWSSKIGDWAPLEDVTELQLLMMAQAGADEPAAPDIPDIEVPFDLAGANTIADSPQRAGNPFARMLTATRRKAAFRAKMDRRATQREPAGEPVAEPRPQAKVTSDQDPRKDPLLKWLLVASVLAFGVLGVSFYHAQTDEELRNWHRERLISDIDLRNWRALRTMDYAKTGPQIDLRFIDGTLKDSRSQIDSKILIVSNIPGRSRLKVFVTSLPGKIVDGYFYQIERDVVTLKGVAKIELDSLRPGDPPPGAYKITVSCEDCPKTASALAETSAAEKTVLIGYDSASYQQELKKFHLIARKRIQEELDELRQILSTARGQIEETANSFAAIRNQGANASQASQVAQEWRAFSKQWQTLQRSVMTTLERYDLRREGSVFHYELFRRAAETMKLGAHLHKLQSDEILLNRRDHHREIQDIEQLLQAQFAGLWAKVARAQKDLSESSELPSRPE